MGKENITYLMVMYLMKFNTVTFYIGEKVYTIFYRILFHVDVPVKNWQKCCCGKLGSWLGYGWGTKPKFRWYGWGKVGAWLGEG